MRQFIRGVIIGAVAVFFFSGIAHSQECRLSWATAEKMIDSNHGRVVPIADIAGVKRAIAVMDEPRDYTPDFRLGLQAQLDKAYILDLGKDLKTGLDLVDVLLVDREGCMYFETGAVPVLELAAWMNGKKLHGDKIHAI